MFRKRQLASSFLFSLAVFTTVLAFGEPAKAQDATSTMTGEVVSSSSRTLTVRTESGQYQLFTYGPGVNRPATLTNGTHVTVISSPSDDAGVRIATSVMAANASNAGQTAIPPAIPPAVSQLERDIERDARRFQLGVRAGVALDPELILIGVQSQIGPFFNSNIYFRPNVEFAWGEVTALFALNPEVIYRLPMTSRQGRWSTYVGVGPGFNLVHKDFGAPTGSGTRVDFSDFHSDVGLNILGGIRFRSGMFTELKTSVYANPSPVLRLIVGYNF